MPSRFALLGLLALVLPGPAQALGMTTPASAIRLLQTPADFAGVTLNGVIRGETGFTLAPGAKRGTLTGPVTAAAPFDELIPSWNARTPAGAALTLEVRARRPGGSFTRYFSFGSWSEGGGRSSLNGQADADGRLDTDTLKLKARAAGYQYRLTLRAGPGGAPGVSLLAFTTSDHRRRAERAGQRGDPSAWGRSLEVPQRSQMIYPGGGEAWCSPTSTSMILAFWGKSVPVPQAAAATFDRAYDGTGNWPFNAAYAASLGLRAFVSRLPSLAAAESFLEAGVPLALSLGWKGGELPGAAVPTSSGHLVVLVGFTASGDPIINDPAAPSDAGVRRPYPRAVFERLWLEHSGGLAYVISPPDVRLPAIP